MNPRLLYIVVSFFGILHCGTPLKCTDCPETSSWSHCHVKTCGPKDKKCFAHVHEHGSDIRIHAGCTGSCTAPHHVPHDLVCHACCAEDHCDENQCRTTTTAPLTNVGIHCVRCLKINNRHSCLYNERCAQDQVCFIQEFTVSPTNSSIFHYSGCINKASCQTIRTHTIHTYYPHQQLQQGKCCTTTGCNSPSSLPHHHIPNEHIRVHQCDKCVQHGVGWTCGEVETCKANQVCYAQKLEFVDDIPGLQPTYYHAGCIDTSACTSINLRSVHSENGLARLVHGECCNTTNCNKNILTKFQTVHSCTKCVLDGVGWKCDEVDTCKPNQVCYVQELELALSIPGLQATYFHAGCIDPVACDTVSQKSFVDEHGLARVIRGECCNQTDCNKSKMIKYKEQYSTTTRAITTSKSTTTAPTTSSTTTPPPSTTEKGHLCQVCTGSECDTHAPVTACSELSPLCLTFLDNDNNGKKMYTKRCASANECDDKWLKETTIKPECIGFHPDTTYSFNFNCTFCCTTDGCNRDHIPSVESLYLKT